jgi:stage III sporulation protein AB
VAELELSQEECACLSGLGTLLGRFDAQEQGKSVNRVRRELEQWAVQARERQRAYGRVYGMLGITAGSALVIMLV